MASSKSFDIYVAADNIVSMTDGELQHLIQCIYCKLANIIIKCFDLGSGRGEGETTAGQHYSKSDQTHLDYWDLIKRVRSTIVH